MTLQIRVKPNARQSALENTAESGWIAHLKSPPVDGKANRELIALLAEHFAVPKSAIAIKSGASGRLKLVRIEG